MMSEPEIETYNKIAAQCVTTVDKPTIVIYLEATPKECLSRIIERGRQMEQTIDYDYLLQLHALYETFYEDNKTALNMVKIVNNNDCFHQTLSLALAEIQKIAPLKKVISSKLATTQLSINNGDQQENSENQQNSIVKAYNEN